LSRIVNGEAVEQHIVKKYRFKDLDLLDEEKESILEDDIEEIEDDIVEKERNHKESQDSVNSEVIENLLSKIEELSNNIVSIQTEFQQQLVDCKSQIEVEKQKAFEDGYNKGIQEAQNMLSSQINEKMKLLEDSIKKVDSIESVFEDKILSIEKELVSVALDIAKEVIQKEISENSKEVAFNLVKSLMDEIKDATKVEIKVNPKDAEYLKSKDLKNVEIVPDEAVKEGGVVIVSDVGNIDAEIKNRFKNIKEAILKENSDDN